MVVDARKFNKVIAPLNGSATVLDVNFIKSPCQSIISLETLVEPVT